MDMVDDVMAIQRIDRRDDGPWRATVRPDGDQGYVSGCQVHGDGLSVMGRGPDAMAALVALRDNIDRMIPMAVITYGCTGDGAVYMEVSRDRGI